MPTTQTAAPIAATPKTKKARPVAKAPVKRPALRKSTRPAGDKRVNLSDIAPAAKKPIARKAKPVAAVVDKKPAVAKAAADAAEQKVVRDGFTMPQADYDKLKSLKAACLNGGVAVKKSELLRAGLHVLEALPVAQLLARMQGLPPVKAGRKKTKG